MKENVKMHVKKTKLATSFFPEKEPDRSNNT